MIWELGGRSHAAVAGAVAVLLAFGSPAVADGPPSHPVGQTILNVTYCRQVGVAQELDLLYPTVSVTYPRPVVLWVHGGTWVHGNKNGSSKLPYIRRLRHAGFIVAPINYDLAPASKYPAQTQDLTCGIRFLRAKASQFGIDPDHIGAMGGSAGGHLVQMLGVSTGESQFVSRGYPHYSSDVQAVASLWGVSDLTRHDLGPNDQAKLPEIFGKPSTWAAASPIHYVRAGLPPFLLVHGQEDTDVPVAQSKRMYRALLRVGVPATLVVVKDAEHQLKPAGGSPSPSVNAVATRVVEFFRSTFKH